MIDFKDNYISWVTHHCQSESLVSQAETLIREGKPDDALPLFRLAAESELKGLEYLASSKTRTIGIAVISSVSLFCRAKDLEKAKEVAVGWLNTGLLPPFAVKELNDYPFCQKEQC